MDGKYYNLWSTDNDRTVPNDDVVIKSVYDPSPVGYSLPASNAFSGSTTTGGKTAIASEFNVKGDFDKGWYFYCKPNKKGRTFFFPTTGYRYFDTGSLDLVTSHGCYGVAGPYDRNYGYYLHFGSGYVSPLGFTHRSYGWSVRSAEEMKWRKVDVGWREFKGCLGQREVYDA